MGMDVSQHGEEAYAEHDGAVLILAPAGAAGEPAAALAAEGGVR
jgi:hypothetical protein